MLIKKAVEDLTTVQKDEIKQLSKMDGYSLMIDLLEQELMNYIYSITLAEPSSDQSIAKLNEIRGKALIILKLRGLEKKIEDSIVKASKPEEKKAVIIKEGSSPHDLETD